MSTNKSQGEIVLISTFKPFINDFIVEQTNALESWKRLCCKPKIVIIGDDEGVSEICEKYGVINHTNVKKNEYGTPLVGDIFKQGWNYATDKDICIFVNGDILLTDSLNVGIERFKNEFPKYNDPDFKYLLTAIRYDWINFKRIDFRDDTWESAMLKGIKGKLSTPGGIDLFIHKKETLDIPYSGIAKLSYDSWMLNYAINNFDVTVNATSVIKVYHQFGKWYQDNKPCARGKTTTKELMENSTRINRELFKNKVKINKSILDCKITW